MKNEELELFIEHVSTSHGFDVSMPQMDWNPTVAYHQHLHATKPELCDHTHPADEFLPRGDA